MFDQAKAEQALEQISNGASLRQTAIAPATICRWAAENPTFAEQYARALEQRADVHADRIEQLAESVESGAIAPDAARVAIDARKWTASKLRPKKYGDRVQLDGDLRVQITVNDPFAPLPATAALLSQPAGAVIAGEIPSLAADGQATPVPPRSAAELCRVPVSENSGQPLAKNSSQDVATASESTPMGLGRATRRSQPSSQVRISPRTGKPVRPYTRRTP